MSARLVRVDEDGGATCPTCGFGFSFKFWLVLKRWGHVECKCGAIFEEACNVG